MNKKIWSAGLIASLMLLGSGCGEKPEAAPVVSNAQNAADLEQVQPSEPAAVDQTAENNGNQSADTSNGSKSAEQPDSTTEEITAYYTDAQLMSLNKASVKISYSGDKEKYAAVFKTLQESDQPEYISLWDKVELKSASFDNGVLTLDVRVPDEANLGSSGEAFAIEALTNTFFQFDEVRSIELLEDGQQTESLMGHVKLEHPILKP